MQTNHRLPLYKFKLIAQFPPNKKKNQIDYHRNIVLNSITNTKRNTTKTTIQSTLEYETEINEAGVKNLRKVGYMGLQPQSMLKNPN